MARGKSSVNEAEVFELIRSGASKSEIIAKTQIKGQSLNNKLLKVMNQDKKFYEVLGLSEVTVRNIKFAGAGIHISKARLKNSDFNKGNEFTMEFDGNKIILTKI